MTLPLCGLRERSEKSLTQGEKFLALPVLKREVEGSGFHSKRTSLGNQGLFQPV